MLVGIVGILRHTDATPPSSYLQFFVGGDLVHDLVVAPIAALVAFVVLRRDAGGRRAAPLRAALFGSAVMIAIAWPGIRHYGRMRAPDNVSVQPLNYATSTRPRSPSSGRSPRSGSSSQSSRAARHEPRASQPILRRDP